jgi:hypothetical protein
MPGSEPVVITLGTRKVILKPPLGMKSFRMMPKILRLLSEWVYAAIQAGIPLHKWFLEGEIGQIEAGNTLRAVLFISEKMDEQWDIISKEIVPFLLQCNIKALDEATPKEIMGSLWTSLSFHAPYVFGEDTSEALKKLVVAEEVETPQADEPMMDST